MRTKKYFDSTKEKYIAMIFKIFLEEGYDNATLSLIIKKLGISKGVFYHYFKNKEECAKQCAKYYTEMCIDNISLKAGKSDTALGQLAEWIVYGAEAATDSSIENINTSQNMIFHQMVMVELVKEIAKVYEKILSKNQEILNIFL